MHPSKKTQKYVIELAVCGIDVTFDPNAKQDIQDEIMARPHLDQMWIRHDIKKKQVIVCVAVDSINREVAEKQMAEELFEIVNAVLSQIDGISIKVVNSTLP